MEIFVLISQKGRLGEGNRRQFEFSLHPLNTQFSLNLVYEGRLESKERFAIQ
jgi:hypothetical protein